MALYQAYYEGNHRATYKVRRVDEASLALVRRVYELAAGGGTDREVGATTGLTYHSLILLLF